MSQPLQCVFLARTLTRRSTAEVLADSRLASAEHPSTSAEAESALATQTDSVADLLTATDLRTLHLSIVEAASTAADSTAARTDGRTVAANMPHLAIDRTVATADAVDAVAAINDNQPDSKSNLSQYI